MAASRVEFTIENPTNRQSSARFDAGLQAHHRRFDSGFATQGFGLLETDELFPIESDLIFGGFHKFSRTPCVVNDSLSAAANLTTNHGLDGFMTRLAGIETDQPFAIQFDAFRCGFHGFDFL